MKYNDFGEKIRDRREALELSLRHLAAEAEIDPAHLSRIETGKTGAPKPETVRKLADAFCRETEAGKGECEQIHRDLQEAAGHRRSHDEILDDLEERFAAKLRASSDMSDEEIESTVQEVSMSDMRSVMEGREPLEILAASAATPEEIERRIKDGESVHMISSVRASARPSESALSYLERYKPEFQKESATRGRAEPARKPKRPRAPRPTQFRAGRRARITVQGKVSPRQRERLDAIAQLIESLLHDPE